MQKEEIRAACNLLKARLLRKRSPLIVGWSLTNRCNSQCLYCSRWQDNSKELSTQQVFDIIEELSQAGTYAVNFTGGEPLLREDIAGIINYAKAKGIRAGVSSNGILVPEKIKDIRTTDFLILSYDGPRDVHDRQRRHGEHQKVVDAVRIAKDNGIYVKLHTVLTKYNIGCIDSILKFAKDNGVIVNFSIIENNPFSEEENIRSLLPEQNKYKSAINEIIIRKAKGDKAVGNSLRGLKYLCEWPDYKPIGCCAGRIYCRIEPNADMYPCGKLVLKAAPQNCLCGGVREAFLGLRFDECKSCWCDTRIDLNYLYSFDFGSVIQKLGELKIKCF